MNLENLETWEFEPMDLQLPPADELFSIPVSDDPPPTENPFVQTKTNAGKRLRSMRHSRHCCVTGIVDSLVNARPIRDVTLQAIATKIANSDFEHFDFIMFLVPLQKAAKMLGVQIRILNQHLETLGIKHWPHRKLLKIKKVSYKLPRETIERAVTEVVYTNMLCDEIDSLAEREYKLRCLKKKVT
jgi:hypothetical protein